MKKTKTTASPRNINLGPELDALVVARLEANSLSFSAYARRLIAADCGRPDLATAVRPGRPWHKRQ